MKFRSQMFKTCNNNRLGESFLTLVWWVSSHKSSNVRNKWQGFFAKTWEAKFLLRTNVLCKGRFE